MELKPVRPTAKMPAQAFTEGVGRVGTRDDPCCASAPATPSSARPDQQCQSADQH